MRHSLAPVAAALCLLGCMDRDSTSDNDVPTGGTLVIASAADAGTLLPPILLDVTGKQVTDQVFDRLAEIGSDLNTVGDKGFTPRLAERWSWAADSLSIAFHLHPDARWHDGRPVRASDVRFSHQLYTDPAVKSPHAELLGNIDSVSVRDSMTAVVWFARRAPEQFFDVTHQLHILPEHLLRDAPRGALETSAFARKPVGSGRFRFVRWEPGATIEVMADTANYRGRPKLDRVIWSVSADPTAAATRLLAGDADYFEALRREQIPDLEKTGTLRALRYPQLAYTFIGFNTQRPLFADRSLRRAIVMSVDREKLVRAVFDTFATAATGPFVKSAFAWIPDTKQIAYDTAAAAAQLDSLGWRDSNGDGIRDRAGQPLSFGLIVPNTSAFRVRMALLLQEELRRAGIDMKIEQNDMQVMAGRQNERRFDAIFAAWSLDPSPSGIRQIYTSAAAAPGGFNYTHYSSPAFDALVDSATRTMDPDRSHEYYARAYETIVQDAPVMFMYELPGLAGAHRRLNVTGMRADAWWAGLDEWSIPADQRIERDGIGLRVVPK